VYATGGSQSSIAEDSHHLGCYAVLNSK